MGAYQPSAEIPWRKKAVGAAGGPSGAASCLLLTNLEPHSLSPLPHPANTPSTLTILTLSTAFWSHKTKVLQHSVQRHQGTSHGFQDFRVRCSSPSCLIRPCSQASFLSYCQQSLAHHRLSLSAVAFSALWSSTVPPVVLGDTALGPVCSRTWLFYSI